jgi:hypothetical protein
MSARPAWLIAAAALPAALAGCGGIKSPDIFAMTRSGGARTVTLVVNDSGSVRCNGGRPQSISDSVLLQAREVANDLHDDASKQLRLAAAPGSVYAYRYRSGDGSIVFADTATGAHPEIARAVLLFTKLVAAHC